MSLKPIVGVPADRRILAPHPFHMVGEKYIAALADCSGVLPLIIPSMNEHLGVDDILDRIDGLFLTGSYSMVAPELYEGQPSEPGTLHDPHRDALALPILIRALARGIPVFAVCRGFQELNVALGGSLHQNLDDVEGYHSHLENKDDPLDVQYGPSHPVALVEGGMLRNLLGKPSIEVNSLHAQGIARLAKGVTVEAIADDGLVEAFSVDGAKAFALAVQWHPEWRATENEFSKAIFSAFGDACRSYAKQRQVTHE